MRTITATAAAVVGARKSKPTHVRVGPSSRQNSLPSGDDNNAAVGKHLQETAELGLSLEADACKRTGDDATAATISRDNSRTSFVNSNRYEGTKYKHVFFLRFPGPVLTVVCASCMDLYTNIVEPPYIVEPRLRREVKSDAIQELAFLDVTYQVHCVRPGKDTRVRRILDGVSGQVNSKEMLALMGPSGSGKTSLLNVLAQRVPHKHVSGKVRVDGSPLSKAFKRRMGFVFQDDMCLWNLTVRETVRFAAKLRLPQSTSEEEKDARVTELLKLLGLSHVADSVIGKEKKRGVSGGERKRVSIGVELINSPDVLFLDEPTSGLDASTALSIITLLRTLTKKGMIVVCSIHQPRSNIFSVFDKVLLLDKGKTVYYGGRASIVKYFHSLGVKLPAETNPAAWILDLTTSSTKLPDGRTLPEAYQHCKARLHQEGRKEGEGRLQMDTPTESTITDARDRFNGSVSDKSEWVTSFWYQMRVLLQRQSKQTRGEVFKSAHLGQILMVTVVASAFWWRCQNVGDIAGLLFFVSMQQSVIGLNTSLQMFPPERGLMIRERSTGSYRVGPYFVAKSLADIGLYTAAPMLFATTVYWCVGLRPDASHFLIYLQLFIAQVVAAQSMGLLLSAATFDFFAATSLAFAFMMFVMLFGGFYVNSENIPHGVNWLKYLSWIHYGFGGLLANELKGREYSCDDKDGKGLSGVEACASSLSKTVTGQDILDYFGFPDVNIWWNLASMLAMTVGLRVITYVLVRRYTKVRQ